MTHIYVTTRFASFHRWKDAPKEVAFLRNIHRHEFHVKLTMSVNHDERDAEFILLKRDLDGAILDKLIPANEERVNYSCETMARLLAGAIAEKYPNRQITCEVSEDGENGACVSL